jgi:hypothetical protein
MCSTSVRGLATPSSRIAGSRLKPSGLSIDDSISGRCSSWLDGGGDGGGSMPAMAWIVGSQSLECARPLRAFPRRAGGRSGDETNAFTRSPPSKYLREPSTINRKNQQQSNQQQSSTRVAVAAAAAAAAASVAAAAKDSLNSVTEWVV